MIDGDFRDFRHQIVVAELVEGVVDVLVALRLLGYVCGLIAQGGGRIAGLGARIVEYAVNIGGDRAEAVRRAVQRGAESVRAGFDGSGQIVDAVLRLFELVAGVLRAVAHVGKQAVGTVEQVLCAQCQ